MTDFLAGLFLGAAVITVLLSMIVGAAHARELAEYDTEIDRLRAALGYLGHSSREPAVQRYVARVLDPDGDEAGA